MEKWGPVILFFLSAYCAATYQPPSSGTSQTDNPTHKEPAGYPLASETSSRTGDFSKAKANHSPGWEKMDLSRRQVISALN